MKNWFSFFRKEQGITTYQLFLAAIFTAVWIWAAINPLYPADWLLENYLIFLFIPIVIFGTWKFKLSDLSLTLIVTLMCLHIVGSHYTYGEVPFGFYVQELTGGARNMYDRMVHFSFGLLIAYPLWEVLMKTTGVKNFASYYLAFDIIVSWSALYELMEWAVAHIVAPEAALAFLGAQGDVWDAQKDMALATAGAVISMTFTYFCHWFKRK